MSGELEEQIQNLRRMGREQLNLRWRDLYKAAPPAAFTPDLLARGLAWRLQEKLIGGLPLEVRQSLSSSPQNAPLRQRASSRVALRPGNRLVRRWRGRTYVVEVTEGGLIYDGMSYSSLTVIATRITGTRWSGPKFFGLVA